MNETVTGLQLEGLEEGIPLCALVILKYLDNDGDYAYQVKATDSLSCVEALGMAHLAVMSMTNVLNE